MAQTWGPFCITITYTVISVILGYSAKGSLDMKKVENWSQSGNTMGLVIMIFLTGAGNVSAYTFMGSPGWSFSRGVAAFYVAIYMAFQCYSNYVVSPRITKLAKEQGLGTQAEAVGVRFESKFLRMLCGIVGAIAVIGNSLVQVIGVGYILNVMSRGAIPMWAGELLIISAIAIYVYASGLRAIGWTNVMQGIMMFTLSCLVGSFVIYTAMGSLSIGEAFRILAEQSPAHLTLPGAGAPFPAAMWTSSILVSIVSFWPQFWIWAAGAKDTDSCRRQYKYLPIFYFTLFPMIVVGFVCVFAFPGFNDAVDRVALTYCLENLPWWLSGLLGAGILAAAQSSAEPQFHTAAYTITHDVIVPAKNLNSVQEGKLQRILLLVVIFAIAYPLALTNPAELVYILLVAYGFVGQLVTVMIGIFVWPRATKAGTMAGLLVGVIVVTLCNTVWVNPMNIHAGAWGLLFNCTIFVIVSLMTEPSSKETLEKFFPKYIMDQLYETQT